jgi:hypothetical protein
MFLVAKQIAILETKSCSEKHYLIIVFFSDRQFFSVQVKCISWSQPRLLNNLFGVTAGGPLALGLSD